MNITKFVPVSVSPEQLEEYRQQYEAAKQEEDRAIMRYNAAYHVYSIAVLERKEAESAKAADKEAYNLYQETYRVWWDKSTLRKRAESVYVWAKRSMVREAAE